MEVTNKIDLHTCEEGDILISSHGHKLIYVRKTKEFEYLDYIVKYYEKDDGTKYSLNCMGSRTNDGYVFKKNRMPEIDHDIVKIIKKNEK